MKVFIPLFKKMDDDDDDDAWLHPDDDDGKWLQLFAYFACEICDNSHLIHNIFQIKTDLVFRT